MPYVAPEVLRGQPYTQKADIYSLGMIMYEVLTGYPPFTNESHDTNLALKIVQGTRPQFPQQVKYPQLLIDLIKKCWEQEPNNRPTAREISSIVGEWFSEDNYGKIYLKQDTEFYHQYEEAEEFNETLPEEIKYPTYQSPEVWHSKPINTQQITQLLQKTPEQQFGSKDLDLDLNNFNLDELTIQENPQEQSSTQAQIEIPPKK